MAGSRGFARLSPRLFENVESDTAPRDFSGFIELPQELQLVSSSDVLDDIMLVPASMCALRQVQSIRGNGAAVVAGAHCLWPVVSLLAPEGSRVEVSPSKAELAEAAAGLGTPSSSHSGVSRTHAVGSAAAAPTMAEHHHHQQEQQQQQQQPVQPPVARQPGQVPSRSTTAAQPPQGPVAGKATLALQGIQQAGEGAAAATAPLKVTDTAPSGTRAQAVAAPQSSGSSPLVHLGAYYHPGHHMKVCFVSHGVAPYGDHMCAEHGGVIVQLTLILTQFTFSAR